jgi:hypothetical protein
MLNTMCRRFAVSTVTLLAMLPGTTQACWLFDCFGHHSRSTFYAPVAAAPVCNTCAPQTVSYVPQTAYRPLMTTTPVTTLRPVTAADPCTGCPTTVMQPTTSYMQRTVMMPYTTYRPVLQTSFYAPTVGAPVIGAPACPTGACGIAPTTTYYQPAAVAPVLTAPAPVITAPPVTQPGCCAATTTPTFGAAMTGGLGTGGALSTAPLYNPGTMSPQRTFNASESPSDANSNVLKPVPDMPAGESKNDNSSLKLVDPQNRTTSSLPAWSYTPVALKESTTVKAATPAKFDDSGWEAAR